MFKKILPVAIGLVLILLIAGGVSLVKKSNDRTPSFKEANSVYVNYGDFKITNDHLYTLMKKDYGVTELLNMVDEVLYAKEVADVDTSSEAFIKYVKKAVFGEEDLSKLDAEKAQETWDDVLSSLQISNILTPEQAKDKSYTNETSEAWKVVKDHYKLAYAREQWAKKYYLEKLMKAREKGENDLDKYFDLNNSENSTNSIEAYFKENYTGSVTSIVVPFTSEKAAYAMMNKYGINTNSKVIINNGWVKSSYDYLTKPEIEDSDKLTYAEVVTAFINMYNDIYRYQNNGENIINSSDYKETLNKAITLSKIKTALNDALDNLKSCGTEVLLPSKAIVNTTDGTLEAKIEWSIVSTDYGTLENNVVKAIFEDGAADVEVTVKYTITFEEETLTDTFGLDFKQELDADGNPISNPTKVDDIESNAFYSLEFTDEFLTKEMKDTFKFKWTKKDATAINSTLADYLTVDSKKLTIGDSESLLYKSYTVTPVEIGNYYFLILKLTDNKQAEIFKKDADGKNAKDSDGNYIIDNQELFDEVVNKKIEAALTENTINEMIYENRYNHNLKIFDSYIEAVYEYEYKHFYETTLSSSDYNKYSKSKKNQKLKVVSFQEEEGNKKSVKSFTAEELFNRLVDKYASSAAATLVENYVIVNDKKFNAVYNPYTGEIYNQTTYKNLMTAEISTLRKNFESNYFTYSYLSYYGFTPNFPAKYGWKKFIKDYFVAYNDQDLLTGSKYGGSIYSDALAAYTDSLYNLDDIKAEMQKAYDKYFNVSTINLIISIDTDYNADDDNSSNATNLTAEKDNWTEEQKTLAKELGKFMYQVANQTNEASISEQMNALVTLYNEAAYEYNEATYNEALSKNTSIYDYNYFGKYKLAGLQVKFETSANYTSASSIMEEYADECRTLYKEAKELGLFDKTFDVPVVSKEAIKTDYGYHMIAIVGATSPKDLPSEEEMTIYRAQAKVDAAQKEIDTANDNIKNYKEKGYDVTSYEATKTVAEEELAKYKEELKAVLAKYSKADDYTLDDEATERITAWYTDAEKTIKEGTIVTESYIKLFKDNMSLFNFSPSNGKERFELFLKLLQEECDKKNADNAD